MFTIPVWDLINSHDGDSKIFSFEWPIFDWYFEDITFIEPLQFKIKLLTLHNGIISTIENLETTIFYENKKQKIFIKSFEREWKIQYDPLDPDDVRQINTKNMTIDLSPIIREEIIMAFHNENL